MFRLTRQTDYGVILMTRIAETGLEATHSARALATELNLPSPMVSKVLKVLAREGLLESRRGAQGGYVLTRDANRITVTDLIAALDGPISITECTDDSAPTCEHETYCQVRGGWQQINRAVQVALSELTLADLSQAVPDDSLLTVKSYREEEPMETA